MNREEKVIRLVEFLDEHYRDIKPPLDDPFNVLIRTIISQRNRDELTDIVFRRLSKQFSKPKDFLKVDKKYLSSLIKPAGLYNQKAENIIKLCKILVDKYGGKVPDSREELMTLPGVGGKTADIVLSYGFGKKVIACDTHVIWISNALGIVNTRDPEKVREELMKLVPDKYKLSFNIRMVEFGKQICLTSHPKCELCELRDICDYFANKKLINKKRKSY